MNVFTKITNKFVKLNSVLIFYSTSLLLGFFVFCVFFVVVLVLFVFFNKEETNVTMVALAQIVGQSNGRC